MTATIPFPPDATSHDIAVVELSKSYGPVNVFTKISFSASPGHRLGLVGENGAGKSTLLRMLVGTTDRDGGTIRRPSPVGYLEQELPYPDTATIDDVVEETLAPIREIEAALTTAALDLASEDAAIATAAQQTYDDALEAAHRVDLWNADARAAEVLAGLSLGSLERSRTIDTLSGGEQVRLELATVLIARPAAMVLDEPTNHLDDAAVDYLISYLRSFPGPVIVASHDRFFLSEACTGILDLDPSRNGLTLYGGDYEHYLKQKRSELARWKQRYHEQQDEIEATQYAIDNTNRNIGHNRPKRDNDKFVHHFKGGRVQNQVSRRVRASREHLEDLLEHEVPRPPDELRFFSEELAAEIKPGPMITAVGVSVVGRLARTDVSISAGDHLLITGPNGAGKSTLLAALAQEGPTDSGIVTWRKGIRVGYLPQEVVVRDPNQSVIAAFDAVPKLLDVTLSDLGLIAGKDYNRPLGELSVGQRRRVALGCLIASAPHVLLLDEPTNHLSLGLTEAFEAALMASSGTIVIASHDRWLRNNWDGEELQLERWGGPVPEGPRIGG